jgi:hypothetical protein
MASMLLVLAEEVVLVGIGLQVLPQFLLLLLKVDGQFVVDVVEQRQH